MVHAKNYKTASKSVKVVPKILWPLFFPDTVYIVIVIVGGGATTTDGATTTTTD